MTNPITEKIFATTNPGPDDVPAVSVAGTRQRIVNRTQDLLVDDEQGMSTVEYAMGSLAAAALAAVLYMVINGGAVVDAIESIITDALSNTPG